MDKKILILGGNQASCDIVKKAQEMGIYTIVTDWYDESKSPAKKIADKSYQISISDIDSIVDLIKKENVSGVITGFTDSYLPYYYEICKTANLPCYGTIEQFEIGTNKQKFKDVCRENKVPTIPEYTIENKNEIKYPVIIKPVDNSGSRGVFKCYNEEELDLSYKEALEFSPSKTVLIEKCVEGQHVNMYYTIIDGIPVLSAMADRYVYFPNKKVAPQPNGLVHPSVHLNEYLEKVDFKVKNMFKNLGMNNGIVFVQGFYDNGEFMIYEIGYRLNGGSTFFLIDKCCGYNQLEMLINYAITGKMNAEFDSKKIKTLEQPDFNNKIGFNLVVSLKKGKITKIQGLEEIKKMKDVVSVIQTHFEGDELTSVGTTRQIFSHILIVSENKSNLINTIEYINNNLSVIDQNDEEMIVNKFIIDNIER